MLSTAIPPSTACGGSRSPSQLWWGGTAEFRGPCGEKGIPKNSEGEGWEPFAGAGGGTYLWMPARR